MSRIVLLHVEKAGFWLAFNFAFVAHVNLSFHFLCKTVGFTFKSRRRYSTKMASRPLESDRNLGDEPILVHFPVEVGLRLTFTATPAHSVPPCSQSSAIGSGSSAPEAQFVAHHSTARISSLACSTSARISNFLRLFA
jgi:hypothetical protein